MQTEKGQVLELILEDGCRHARLSCPSNLIPSVGQYLLAGDRSDSPLPFPLFYTDSALQGFIATPIPDSWTPGMELYLRGPFGHGFTLQLSARKIGLVSFDISPARLRGLIQLALKQDAAVVLLCDSVVDHLPDEVEVQPVSALNDIVDWADYLAFDVARENLSQIKERLGKLNQIAAGKDTQTLIQTPVPCGGVAECGVCAVTLKSGWKLACKDGPVFRWRDILM